MTAADRLAAYLADRPPAIVSDPGRKPAAVAIVVAPDPDALLLIRRAERAGDTWSGHMAFPGGRWSPDDPDLLTTAKRETLEEVGLDLAESRYLGRLDDFVPRSRSLPPIMVTPFVFAVDRSSPLTPNHEVAGAHWTTLARLLDPAVYRPFEYDLGGTPVTFPGYHLEEGLVWGMTERILTPLLAVLGAAR